MAAAQIISGYKTVAFIPNIPVWRLKLQRVGELNPNKEKEKKKENNEGLRKVEEVTVGCNMEDKMKEESRGGGQVSWKQLKCEANEGLQDCKNWPNELACGKYSSV